MIRPFARAFAIMFLALGSLSAFAAAEIPLPEFVPSGANFYPESAARKLLQGSVGVEFQIDGGGRAQILGQTFVDDPDFAASASELLKQGHFKIPADWVESGGSSPRFNSPSCVAIPRARRNRRTWPTRSSSSPARCSLFEGGIVCNDHATGARIDAHGQPDGRKPAHQPAESDVAPNVYREP